MCSKTCHLVNAALITQVKTTALGALDPSLVAWFFLATGTRHLVFLFFLGFFFLRACHQRDSQNAPAWPQTEWRNSGWSAFGDRREFKHDTAFRYLPLSRAALTWKLKHLGENTGAWMAQSLILNSSWMHIFLSLTRQSRSSASSNTFLCIIH